MDKHYACLQAADMKIISEAERKLSESTGRNVALVAYDNQ